MARENLYGVMVVHIRANSLKIISKVLVYIHGLMAENSKVNGKTIKWTEKENSRIFV